MADPNVLISHKYGTASQWTENSSYVLGIAEIGVESDTHKLKVGDGVTTWASLPYIGGATLSASEQRLSSEIFNQQTAVTSGNDRTPFAGKIFIADPAVVGSTGSNIDGASAGDIWLW